MSDYFGRKKHNWWRNWPLAVAFVALILSGGTGSMMVAVNYKRVLSMVSIAAFAVLLAACSDGRLARDDSASLVEMVADAAVDGTVPAGAGGQVTSAHSEAVPAVTSDDKTVVRPEGWTDETHGKLAVPNYEVVFPRDKVNQITITIAPDDWEAMQADMRELFGAPGTGQGGAAPAMEGFAVPEGGQRPNQPRFPGGELPQARPQPGGELPFGGGQPGGEGAFRGAPDGPGFGGNFAVENPMWVPATIEFEGKTWTNVGVRYKGNSSLRSSWGSGTLNLPLRFNFDKFEDEYPEIDNQRFYGFKKLTLANGWGDSSYMRDTLTYDLLREAGLVAAETAHYEVILDYGEGPVSLGLYVMIEVIDDTVVKRYFDDDSGNIYKPEGAAASLAVGTFDRIEDSFAKKTNEKQADWSDIEALYEVLHSEERTTNPQSWRSNLEAIFDVESFLKFLAISAAIGHWDTYGQMSHNYYLYNDPSTGRLTWISWDHNLVLGAEIGGGGGMAGGPAGGVGGRGNVSLDKANVGANWPLIRYLLDVPDYYAAYVGYLEETVSGPFDPDRMEAKYREMAELVGPYVAQETGAQAFETALQGLIQATRERARAVNDFLATQPSSAR